MLHVAYKTIKLYTAALSNGTGSLLNLHEIHKKIFPFVLRIYSRPQQFQTGNRKGVIFGKLYCEKQVTLK
jgi:hypothetical protein